MPYGYYQLVRLFCLIVFVYLSYIAFQWCKFFEMAVYLGLALLFQPFFKIALGRSLWNLIDIFVGVALMLSIWKKQTLNEEK